MIRRLWQAFAWSVVIAATLFSLLLLGDRLFPQLFKTHIELYHLLVLFAVAFIPRLISWTIGLIPRRSRRRKT